MGAGRKTSTYDIDTGAAQLGFVERQRNLGENLGGVIFGCSHETYDECVNGLIFGLPRPHICYVQYIVPGMPVFLYNYSDRTMHGIFKAVSEGDIEINPKGWTTFPNQRTQYPAQVRVEVYNQCPSLLEREFRPILKDCYTQDTSQSSRLCFELKRSEAQNLCRAFNNAAARVNLGVGASRPSSSQASAPSGKGAGATTSNSADQSQINEEIFPALGSSDWQQVPGKKRRDAFDPTAPSTNSAWVKPGGSSAKAPATTSASASSATTSAPEHAAASQAQSQDRRTTPPMANGGPKNQVQEELRADPAALASGAYDAPSKKDKQRQSDSNMPPAPPDRQQPSSSYQTTRQPPSSSQSSATPATSNLNGTAHQTDKTQQMNGHARAGQPQGPSGGPRPASGSHQSPASDLLQLRDALQTLPPSVAEAISRHVGCTNETLQKAETERRALMRGLADAQSQLAVLPQLQAEQRQLREGAAAMAAELVSLRHHMAYLSHSTGPNAGPGGRLSPNGLPGPRRSSPMLSAANSGSVGLSQALQGQELYLTGGNDGVRWLDAVEVYTPSRNSWVTAEAMPLERGYGAAAAVGRQMFVMGGGNGSSWLQSVMMCNLEAGAVNGSWVEVAPMDNVRGSLAAVALDNKLYAMGGGQPNVNRDTTEVYEAQRNQWLPGPTMNHRRFTTAATLHNNSIFVSGGYDGTQYLRSVERLDPREGKWQLVAEMQQKRGSHASTVAFDQVFALGGWDAHAFLDSVEIYDVRTDSWRYVANMEDSRAYGAAVTVDGNVFALGGMRDQQHNEVIERYDSAKNCWHKITPPPNMLHKRAFLAACVMDLN